MKAIVSVFLVLAMAGFAPAAEPAHRHAPTPEMRKQHNSMSVMGKQWAVCKKCLETGDFTAAGESLARMQKAADDLEEFKLHRNADKRQQFVERSRAFREKVVRLKDALQAGDGNQTRELGKAVGDDCTSCHRMFK